MDDTARPLVGMAGDGMERAGPADDSLGGSDPSLAAQRFELKARLLVEGIDFGALGPGAWKERTEHLYRHDQGRGPATAYPQEIVLGDDVSPANRTVVTVRYVPGSPWRVSSAGRDRFQLDGPGVRSLPVAAVARPAYYDRSLGDLPVSAVVQHLGLDALGVVPNNHCYYFVNGDQCRFCEIEPTYRDVVGFPQIRKSVATLVDGLADALTDTHPSCVIVTAGNLRSNDRMAAIYEDFVQSLSETSRMPLPYVYGSLMAPDSAERIGRLRRAGFDGIGFNMEFFDAEQLALLAPGKHSFGRDRLLDGLRTAVAEFGVGNVFSNLVYGIQTWRPDRPLDSAAEVGLCLEATEALLADGILPLFTLYHSSGRNAIGDVALDLDGVLAFHRQYAELVVASGLSRSDMTGVLFNVCTIANHIYNDAVAAERAARRAASTTGGVAA